MKVRYRSAGVRLLSTSNACATLLVASAVLAPAPVFAQSSDRPDGMRFIPDVYGQFRSLTRLAEPLGLHISTTPNPSHCRHYQGIARVDGQDGTPFFWVTRSGNLPDIFGASIVCDDSPGERYNGNLVVFRMGSRDHNGERLRSNRLKKGVHVNQTEPPDEDVATIYFTVVGGDDPGHPDPCMRPGLLFREGFIDEDGDGDNDCSSPPPHVYQHPGGMQRVGHVLAMAMDTPRNPLGQCYAACSILVSPADAACRAFCDSTVHYEMASSPSRIMFFDVTEPEAPVFRSQFVPTDHGGDPLHDADGLALTPIVGDRYLLAVSNGFYGDEPIYFYRSTSSDLASADLTWELVDSDSDMNDHDEDAHQSLHFLREGNIDGRLFLAASRGHPVFGADHDKLDLMEVLTTDPQYGADATVTLDVRYHGQAMGTFPSTFGNRIANLAAATGFYESPSGELIFYATEHDNDGPDETVKMGEWRHEDMVREGSSTLLPSIELSGPFEVDEGSSVALDGSAGPPATRAFIQLFDDTEYGGLYPVVDFDDVEDDDFDDFATLEYFSFGPLEIRFNDNAKSWKWYAPVGCSVRAIDHESGSVDEVKTLDGTGHVERDPFLSEVYNDAGNIDISEEIDAIEFPGCDTYYATPVALTWDLDHDGSFETTGTSPAFDASQLDGPSTVSVPTQAQHPAGGEAAHASATVTVRNVAPALSQFSVVDSGGNVIGVDIPFVLTNSPVSAHALFSDPGRLDHQTASIDWGDGAIDPQSAFALFDEAFGDGTGELRQAHSYAVGGIFPIVLLVTDDDAGEDGLASSVRVVTPEQAVGEILTALDDLIAHTTDPHLIALLLKARKALVGSPPNTSQNGALAKIQAGNDAAAIAFLEDAIHWLEEGQAQDPEIAALIIQLEQVIAAL